jgi:hypothetical protein
MDFLRARPENNSIPDCPAVPLTVPEVRYVLSVLVACSSAPKLSPARKSRAFDSFRNGSGGSIEVPVATSSKQR